MKITMYGAEICGDCVWAKKGLTGRSDVELEYKNITADTATLKEFLAYRDSEELFNEVKKSGSIGIPFFILENGDKTLDISKYVEMPEDEEEESTVAYCSIDHKGSC